MFEVRFPTNTLARLIDCPPSHLHELVAAALVNPVVRGSKGRGKHHQFSLNQAVALAVVLGFQRARGKVRQSWAERVVAVYEAQPLEVAYQWAAQQTGLPVTFGPHTEEAKWQGSAVWDLANIERAADDPFSPWEAEQVMKDVRASFQRIATEAIYQLGQARAAGGRIGKQTANVKVPDDDE